MQLFGGFQYPCCVFAVEASGYSILDFLIAGLDVHPFDTFEEVLLFLAHLCVDAASFCNAFMVVDVWRVVVATDTPIGFECPLSLFDMFGSFCFVYGAKV